MRPMGDNLRFAFLTFRPYEVDFQRYLMHRLQLLGHPCVHIILGRRQIEIRSGEDFIKVERLGSIGATAAFLKGFFAADTGVVINSTGNSGPDLVLRLWLASRDAIWIYDVFDWMLYDAKGVKRLKWWLTDRAYASIARRCCVRSADLLARYKEAFHLQNASHILPARRSKEFDRRVVVTASFDRRTDFSLLRGFARQAPDIQIDLYGSIHDGDAETLAAIGQLTASFRNVHYYGAFTLDELQGILDKYAVGLLPYRTRDVMTRFISPNKLFDYICAGLEVIATPLPAARKFGEYLHLASGPGEIVAAVARIAAGDRRNPGNLHAQLNWLVRAHEFRDAVWSACSVPQQG